MKRPPYQSAPREVRRQLLRIFVLPSLASRVGFARETDDLGFDYLPLFERGEDSKEHMAQSGSRPENCFAGDYSRALDYIRECEALGVTKMKLVLPPDYDALRTEARRFAGGVMHGV